MFKNNTSKHSLNISYMSDSVLCILIPVAALSGGSHYGFPSTEQKPTLRGSVTWSSLPSYSGCLTKVKQLGRLLAASKGPQSCKCRSATV